MIYQDIVECFKHAGYEVASLETTSGCVACIAAAARVIACAPTPQSESFLFNPEGIQKTVNLRENLFCDPGAPGGDRLWIAPEYRYHWLNEPKDTESFSNYKVPKNVDPGCYKMSRNIDSVLFKGHLKIPDHCSGGISKLKIERQIIPITLPLPDIDVVASSYQIVQRLMVAKGSAGLWNIAQFPIGSLLVLPLRSEVLPKPYFNSAEMCLMKDALGFYITGKANAKIGYSSAVATGKSAAFFMTGDMLNMVLRENAVVQDGGYCDGVSIDDADGQVLQAWDGFGFGELEYHSLAAGEAAGSWDISDTSFMHGVRGKPKEVLSLAEGLLGVSMESLICLMTRVVSVQ